MIALWKPCEQAHSRAYANKAVPGFPLAGTLENTGKIRGWEPAICV